MIKVYNKFYLHQDEWWGGEDEFKVIIKYDDFKLESTILHSRPEVEEWVINILSVYGLPQDLEILGGGIFLWEVGFAANLSHYLSLPFLN